MGILIAIIVSIIAFGGALGLLFYWRNRVGQMKLTKHDRSEIVTEDNTQSLLPFEKIKLNRVFLGKQRYVTYIKVKPFNYLIRSEEGKDAFAINLRNAYNGFDFRTQIFTHTRKMVNDKMLRKLSETIEDTLSVHPDQKEYAEEYFRHLSVINVRDPLTGDLRRVKDFYIVVPWEPTQEEAGMTEQELEYRAKEELRRRIHQVRESFRSAGIQTYLLNTIDIIELFTSIYRREESSRPDLLFDQSYTGVMVSGDEDTNSASEIVRFTAILEGAKNRLAEELINNPNITDVSRNNAIRVSNAIDNIQRKIKGE